MSFSLNVPSTYFSEGTFLIKRREYGESGPPPFLSAGQFAFNKVNETLYLGTSGSIIPVGGPGAFVTNSLLQSLSGAWQLAYTDVTTNSSLYIHVDGGFF